MSDPKERCRAGDASGRGPEVRAEPPGCPGDGRSAFYVRYIGSARWLRSAARLEELRASGYRCRVCNSGPPDARLEVHHRTYARLGREIRDDLTTLCQQCHRAVTSELRDRKGRSHVWTTRDVGRVTPRKLPHARPGEV